MKFTTIITGIIFLVLSISAYGQVGKRRNYFPVWTYHQDSIDIHGISVGLWSLNNEPRFTYTNGIKLEMIGLGLLMPLIPQSPIPDNYSEFARIQNEPLSERINGLNLSLFGTTCHCLTNGLIAGFIGQSSFQVNGISTSLLINFVQKQNGLMLAMFNDSFLMNGLQIGFFNKSKKLNGIQLGLWNVDQKRKWPLINWNFRHGTSKE